MLRADRAEDVGRLRSLVVWRRWSRTSLCPASGNLVLLTDPRFVLPPNFYQPVAWETRFDLCQLGCEAPFLNASIASGSCA